MAENIKSNLNQRKFFEYDDNLDGYVIRFYTIGWLENDKELEIPEEYKGEDVVGIRGDVFANVKTLEKVVLPDTIKEIRGQAFQYASNLEEINIPEGVTEIGRAAFFIPLTSMSPNSGLPPLIINFSILSPFCCIIIEQQLCTVIYYEQTR